MLLLLLSFLLRQAVQPLALPSNSEPRRTGTHADAQPGAQIFGNGNATWQGTPQVLSWRPLATLYEDFLTEAECDYLLNISRPLMEPAMLVNRKQQKHIRSKARTSWGAFHDSLGDPVLAAITQRIAHVVRVAPGNFEPWQVMKYGPDEEYTSHVDYYERDTRFFGNDTTKFGGQRIMTALLYLTTCKGGETVLRKAASNAAGQRSCQGKGVGVPARKGRMLVFHNVQHDGMPDNRTSHVSCPVTHGEKVVVSRFIRQDTCYLNKDFSKRKWNGNVYCADDHARCAEWAAQGYCTDSKASAGGVDMHEIMVGDTTWPGFCERTCNACRPLEQHVVDMRKELGMTTPAEARHKTLWSALKPPPTT